MSGAFGDYEGFCRDAWKHKGLTPDRLAALTPHEFAAAFLRPAAEPRVDPVEELASSARAMAARGVKPIAPSWLWPWKPRADGRVLRVPAAERKRGKTKNARRA